MCKRIVTTEHLNQHSLFFESLSHLINENGIEELRLGVEKAKAYVMLNPSFNVKSDKDKLVLYFIDQIVNLLINLEAEL